MVTQVIMPKLAANVEEATIGQWFKSEGDPVERDDLLFEAITDKAVVEVKAEGEGVLRKVYATENSVVPVGDLIAVIAEPDEELPAVQPRAKKPAPAERKTVKASFGARRLAKELGVDILSVTSSRPDGRITEADVRRTAATAGGPAIQEKIPHSPVKRALAEHLTRTSRDVPTAFMTLEVDCTKLLDQDAAPRDVLVHVAAGLLKRHRLLNACYTDDGVVVYAPIHIGIALDVERDDAVLAPVVRDADTKDLAAIAAESASLLERLEAHELAPEDLADATFTVADQSALGIDGFVPILNDRQSAILAMSTIRPRPVVRDGAVAVASTANLAVVFDHRVLNGTSAAAFLRAVKDEIEAL